MVELRIGDFGFRNADLGCEMKKEKYRLPFTVYDFNDFNDLKGLNDL